MIRNVRRIDFDLQLTQGMVENSTLEPHTLRNTGEHDRNTDGDFLTGHERLEIDVKNLTLDRMPLDLANERLRGVSSDCDLDDGALCLNVGEHLVEVPRI